MDELIVFSPFYNDHEVEKCFALYDEIVKKKITTNDIATIIPIVLEHK